MGVYVFGRFEGHRIVEYIHCADLCIRVWMRITSRIGSIELSALRYIFERHPLPTICTMCFAACHNTSFLRKLCEHVFQGLIAKFRQDRI